MFNKISKEHRDNLKGLRREIPKEINVIQPPKGIWMIVLKIVQEILDAILDDDDD